MHLLTRYLWETRENRSLDPSDKKQNNNISNLDPKIPYMVVKHISVTINAGSNKEQM